MARCARVNWVTMSQSSSIAFLFLDESQFEPLDLAALTGVLVRSEVYNSVRDAMCRIIHDVQASPPQVVEMPIELHASRLLKNLAGRDASVPDELRLRIFAQVVNIVNSRNISVYRNAYLNRSKIAPLFRVGAESTSDSKLYAINFHHILSMIQPELARSIIVPVMDGIPACADPSKRARIDPNTASRL